MVSITQLFHQAKVVRNKQQVNHVTMTPYPQLFKRRNVCVPSNDESMLECPIQDPDISSTVPVAGVSVF